jgi:hypothetical protein
MKNKEIEHVPEKQSAQIKMDQTQENFESELVLIRASLQKGKSDTTTLKILFYTGLAVLLLGFIYTNQTLQRAQHRNVETHINLLQNQVNHTLLLMEKKLHKEIIELDAKLNGEPSITFHKRIQNMNFALDRFQPQSTSTVILVKKVQRVSNELSQLVESKNLEETLP